ncbi:MAG TPA: tRNA (guanosine(46)-N7)-methyltransferase TrmB [Methylomirabilota bacterium]|nr:tRNA (guanosine(46)-N7)-methyltransferase TrmB [Methylomirabilota bacterium]
MHPSPASLIHRITDAVHPLDAPSLFPAVQPLEVELGSGDGSFILDYAARHPEHNFLAVERLLGRLRKIDRKGTRLGLANLRGLRIEAGYFLEHLLPANSTLALHLYFPDPWPKRRHWKNRLVNERFPALARRVLIPGGPLHLRTDNPDYFEQMTLVFREAPSFERVETPPELLALKTDFEQDFNARGIPTLHATYLSRGEPPTHQ